MTLLRETAALGYNPREIVIENGNYVVLDAPNEKIKWYDNGMNLLRETGALGYNPRGLTIENGNYVVVDYVNQKIKWCDNGF